MSHQLLNLLQEKPLLGSAGVGPGAQEVAQEAGQEVRLSSGQHGAGVGQLWSQGGEGGAGVEGQEKSGEQGEVLRSQG